MNMTNFFDWKLKVWQWLLIMISIALLVTYILYSCEKNKTTSNPTEKPILKPDTKIKEESVKDSTGSKKTVDSLNSVFNKIDKQLSKTTTALFNAQDDILFLQQENDSLVSLLKASELTNAIASQNDKIREQIRLNDSLCNNIISGKQKLIDLKDVIISERELLYSKIRNSLDTCLKNNSILTKSAKKDSSDNKQRNKLGIGPAAIVYPEVAFGGGIVFIDKKERVYNADLLIFNKAWYVGLSYKWIIHTRRKK